MFVKRRVAALTAMISALALAAPVASAAAAAIPAPGPAVASFGCPVWYRPTDPVTACTVHWAIDPPRIHHQTV
jgi:hypothetical protein